MDFNQGFVSFYTTSNIWQNYPYQDKESLRKIVKELVKEVDLLRIEDLNFNRTKANMLKATSKKGKAYNAMLNKLPYKMFKDLVMIDI